MNAIGYCRVSTEEQVIEGFSLETQEREIKRYCQENNINLLYVYVDSGVSAFKNFLKDRPQGKLVVEHLFSKDIDAIISISDDRMFRNMEDSIVINNIAEKHQIEIIYTRQQYYNTMDPFSSFIIKNFNAMMNQSQSMQYSVKVKGGLENKIRKGEWNGQAPYGYKLVDSHLQVIEEQANVIKLIFDLYLSKCWGSENICNYLNDNNITPPKNSKYWSKTSILCMLKNPVYTGKTVFNRRAPKRSGKKMNSVDEWLIMENTHEAIITEEDFNKVQINLESKRRNCGNVDRTQTSKAPLSGLVYCSNCHNLYTYTFGVSKKRGRIYYYQCGSKRHGNSVCKRHNIPAVLLEKFVLYRIREILTSDMYKERFEEQLNLRLESLKAKKRDIKDLENNLSKLITQKEKLLNLIIEEDSKQIIDTYKEKLNSVLGQISTLNDTMSVYSKIDIEEEEKEIRKQFKLSYEDITYKDFQELDRDQMKVLFNMLIDHIDIQELEFDFESKVCLNITIYLKIPGYAPKYALEFLKGMRTEDIEKKNSHFFQNESSKVDGGEQYRFFMNNLNIA